MTRRLTSRPGLRLAVRRALLSLATGLAVALVASGCGQFPGVHDNLAGGDNGLGSGADGAGGPGGPGAGPGGGSGRGSGSDGGSGSGGGPGGKGDSTGVTGDSITIGVHAPLTGAAPLRQDSFEVGKDLYWKYGNNGKPIKINGRTVKVVFADDRYRPSHARQVCQQMAERQKAFLLVGGAGADQIQACAQFSEGRGIPYISGGVQERGLRGFGTYFADSHSYPAQMPLLADYVRKEFGTSPSKVAGVITNTPNFDDAAAAFKKAFPGARVFRPDKNANGSSMAGNLCTGTSKNYDVVMPLTAPTFYLQMAAAAACRPQYAGVGVTMGVDTVASVGCDAGRSTENARFLHPAPAFEDARRGKWDPAFMRAARAAGVEADDVMWLFWGHSKVIHQLLAKPGRNLTRQRFIASTQTASVRTNVFPQLRYSPSNHFGSQQVSVLRNVCQRRGDAAGYYITDRAFVSSF